jgi:hypothetical protein
MAYWLAIWAGPSRHIGVDSRFNFVGGLSYALLICGILAALPNRKAFGMALVALGAGLMTTAMAYQLDYASASANQGQIRSYVRAHDSDADTIYVYHPPRHWKHVAMETVGSGYEWQQPNGKSLRVLGSRYLGAPHADNILSNAPQVHHINPPQEQWPIRK